MPNATPTPKRSLVLGVSTVGLIYGGSIGLLFFGELRLAHHLSEVGFGQYNLVRQAIPLVVALAILGYDQGLTRQTAARGGTPARLDRRQWRLVFLTLGTGGLAAAYLASRLNVPWPIALTLCVGAAAVALSSLVSGVMRASNNTAVGAFAQQGYRLLAGTAFVCTASVMSSYSATITLCSCAVLVAGGCVLWSRKLTTYWEVNDDEYRFMRRLGIGYSLSMLSLAAGDWIDQVMLGEISGSLALVGQYGQVKLVALYPVLSVGSILGFMALPAIAARRDSITRQRAARWLVVAASVSVIFAAVMIPVSKFAIESLFSVRPSWMLVSVLCAVGGLRLFYVLPSALMGASASPRWLIGFGLVGLLGLAAQVLVTLVFATGDILTAVALGLLVATSLRVVASVLLCLRQFESSSLATD